MLLPIFIISADKFANRVLSKLVAIGRCGLESDSSSDMDTKVAHGSYNCQPYYYRMISKDFRKATNDPRQASRHVTRATPKAGCYGLEIVIKDHCTGTS
ncbi:hypothetical protein WAI453_001100 [Rhynchosporium graminicola]